MKHLSKSLLMGALISLAGIVSAQQPIPSGRGPMPFSVFDHNGDGAISQQEFASTHAQRQQARAILRVGTLIRHSSAILIRTVTVS
jgi:hypothetical protein